MNWQPSATIDTLKQRARLIQTIRQFFIDREVLEVDTPALSGATVTDVHLSGFATEFSSPIEAHTKTLYLQTSPEFAMKRLLSAGTGAIFQLCKSFRNEEAGSHHNPEFTMLEWYRPGYTHVDLMQEVDELIQHILNTSACVTHTYQSLFIDTLQLDPLEAEIETIKEVCEANGFADIAAIETNKDTLLQLLFSHLIEPSLGFDSPVFVTHFPASQAALACISKEDKRVAERFELYCKGIELANGFHELTDPAEQQLRFTQDNQNREKMGIKKMPIDQHLIDALEAGMPQCAGVALGVDRLMMLALDKHHISEVITFSINNA